MIENLIERMRGWLSRRGAETARARPGEIGLELDIARGTVRQVRVRPFAVRPDSARCIPSRPREE